MNQLPNGFTIRELKAEDYKGYLELLSQLSLVGNITEKEFLYQYIQIIKNHNHYIIVIEDDKSNIAGCCTLLIEPKFLHNCGYVGHIEDVVIHQNYRKYGLGSIIINHMLALGKSKGCYKIILDCKPNNVPFYEKNGFYSHEISMRSNL